MVGIALSIALRHTSSANRRLAIVLWLQGIGVLAARLLPGIGGLLTGGLLVGGGFLCAVQLSLLYGRELAPDHTRYMAGLLTTGYAIGQLVGPVTSALSTAHAPSGTCAGAGGDRAVRWRSVSLEPSG